MTEDQRIALDMREKGLSRQQISEKMGKSVSAVKALLERARRWVEADPSARAAAAAVGGEAIPHSAWHKRDGVSVYYKYQQPDAPIDSLIDRVAESFKDIPAYVPVTHDATDNDLMVVYPLYDLHAGMLADSQETRGHDYDLSHFKSDLLAAIGRLNSRVPASSHALMIFGGDTLHVNDYSNETPAHKHKQDADSRFEKITDIAIEAVTHAIEEVSSRHARVSVVVIRGNHDDSSHIVLKAALKQRYRESPRIQFPAVSGGARSDIFWMQHGKTLIAAHHGDKMKPETLAMICADQCEYWSATRHRAILTGHRHHLRVLDMPGLTHYTMRAFAPADAYGSSFGGVRGLQAMVFDDAHGLVAQFHDGIWRDDD